MQKKDRFKELLSIPAVATYVGTAASIWAIATHYLLQGVIVLSLLSVILLLYNIGMYRRYVHFKRYKVIDAELHRLTHRTHDFLLDLRIANNHGEYDKLAAIATKNALNVASNVFSTLIASPCTASLMLHQKGRLTTSLYCHNVDPQRENTPSKGLDSGEGIAGQAFVTGDAVVWTVEDHTFREIRKDFKRFYLSGISVPFKVGGQYAGLLNVDCKLAAGFDLSSHKELAMSMADVIGLVSEALQLRQDLR